MPLDCDKIRMLRERLGLSQAEAAKKAKLKTRQAWSRIESGGQPNLGLQFIERIAAVLGVQARDLLK